jgi:glycosyltransferase involved in cell wall biosynthesis
MKRKYKISIATVVYNACNYIEKTILSVINQSYNNIEYIIIDGASTDGTLDIIKKYQNKVDIFISEPDKGIYDAMNKVLKLASGDFIIFINANDFFYSNNTIEECVNLFYNSTSLYYGKALFYKDFSENIICEYGEKINAFKLSKRNICQQTIFYPKFYYKKNSFDLEFKILSDWEYNMRAYSKKIEFRFIDKIISYYEYSGISSRLRDHKFEKKQKYIILKNLGIKTFSQLVLNKLNLIR